MTSNDTVTLPDSLISRLRKAKRFFVMTGAGMSAESGIPTFRDAQTGIWKHYRPEELATPEAFRENPERVWNWYQDRRDRVRQAQPHAGHHALVSLANDGRSVRIATQNVDGLHQAAGSDPVIELHGNILRSVCHLTGKPISEEWLDSAEEIPPRSPHCEDGLARPAVVWFGEALPAGAINGAIEAAATSDMCFSIGTTSLVQPAAGLPLIALENGACLIEINPHETPLSLHADYCLRAPASTALTEIMRCIGAAGDPPAQVG